MVEYRLVKEGNYQRLKCKDNNILVKELSMFGFGDVIDFSRRNEDGSSYGSSWGIYQLKGAFPELNNYKRLQDMPQKDLANLASRMNNLLFQEDDSRLKQILEELTTLKGTQKRLLKSGKIVFPNVSDFEEMCKDSW